MFCPVGVRVDNGFGISVDMTYLALYDISWIAGLILAGMCYNRKKWKGFGVLDRLMQASFGSEWSISVSLLNLLWKAYNSIKHRIYSEDTDQHTRMQIRAYVTAMVVCIRYLSIIGYPKNKVWWLSRNKVGVGTIFSLCGSNTVFFQFIITHKSDLSITRFIIVYCNLRYNRI